MKTSFMEKQSHYFQGPTYCLPNPYANICSELHVKFTQIRGQSYCQFTFARFQSFAQRLGDACSIGDTFH